MSLPSTTTTVVWPKIYPRFWAIVTGLGGDVWEVDSSVSGLYGVARGCPLRYIPNINLNRCCMYNGQHNIPPPLQVVDGPIASTTGRAQTHREIEKSMKVYRRNSSQGHQCLSCLNIIRVPARRFASAVCDRPCHHTTVPIICRQSRLR